jgi:carbonic anhydrase
MSTIPCSVATAPVNIDTSVAVNKCTLKCEYKFNYKDSYCSATNMGEYLKLSYDALSSENVIYNLTKYTVSEIRIYWKSLHTFNGSKSDAEMIIIHTSTYGKPHLLVCVPIVRGNSNSVATGKLNTILDNVAQMATGLNNATGLIPDLKYNLNSFIPKKPFYMYNATESWSPCSTRICNYIVFTPSSDTNIYMNQFNYDNILKKVINAHAYTVKPITSAVKNFLSFNSQGATISNGDDEIYIDCKPVGESDESKTVVTNTGTGDNGLSSNVTPESVFNNIFIQMIVGSFIFVIFILIVAKFLSIAKVTRHNALKGGYGSWFYTTGAAS